MVTYATYEGQACRVYVRVASMSEPSMYHKTHQEEIHFSPFRDAYPAGYGGISSDEWEAPDGGIEFHKLQS